MDSPTRLQLASRLSYYIACVFAIFGALEHFGLGASLLRSINLTQRNLFEASVMFFLISATSILRAGGPSKH